MDILLKVFTKDEKNTFIVFHCILFCRNFVTFGVCWFLASSRAIHKDVKFKKTFSLQNFHKYTLIDSIYWINFSINLDTLVARLVERVAHWLFSFYHYIGKYFEYKKNIDFIEFSRHSIDCSTDYKMVQILATLRLVLIHINLKNPFQTQSLIFE